MRSSTYVTTFCMSRKMIWHSFENDALAPLRPCGNLVQLNCALLNGSVKDVNGCEDFSNGMA